MAVHCEVKVIEQSREQNISLSQRKRVGCCEVNAAEIFTITSSLSSNPPSSFLKETTQQSDLFDIFSPVFMTHCLKDLCVVIKKNLNALTGEFQTQIWLLKNKLFGCSTV